MNDEIIHATIAKMREAGLSDSVIGSTLSDLGLNAAQVQSYLAGPSKPENAAPVSPSNARSYSSTLNPVSPPPSPAASLDHEALASRVSDKLVQRLDERDQLSNEETDLTDKITHLALEQHGQQLESTHQAVMDLHEKFDTTSLETFSNRLAAMNGKMDALTREVADTKALLSALQSLMQKILEANQQLVFDSKNKK